MKRILGLALAVTASLALAATASAEPLRIRGTIVATSSNSITVHTGNGDITASLNAKTGFVSVEPSNLNTVGPGSYLGVASKADGDKRIALSVIVFPPAMNGVAEGNAVYDPLPDTTLFRRHAYRRQHDQRQRQVYQPWRECSPRQQRYDQRQRRDRDGKGRREVCKP